MTGRTFDPIELEVLWQSLIATVNEQAKALQRAAFSPIVREAGDLANAVFDRRARMVAQAVTGTPGHINSLALGAAAILDEYPPDSLAPGDVLITNDPYKTAGQLLDVTVLVPVFKDGRVIAFFGSTIHHTDVGGYGIGAGGRDVFEEGLWIPICKLHVAGERNPDVWKFILSNVRQPDHMAGDLHAQVASGEVGSQRLLALCRRSTAWTTSRTWPTRSSSARRPPPGPRSARCPAAPTGRTRCSTWPTAPASTSTWRSRSTPTPARCSSTTRARPAASPYGINVVKNYTHAYTTFAVRSVLNPEIPNNHGSLAPIKVEAPEGSIVNAVSPQPGTARHVVGMFLPNALLKALAQVKPDQAMAEGSGAVWTMQVNGHDDDGRPFITAMFTYAGGVGRAGRQARAVGLLVPDRRRGGAGRGGRGQRAHPLPPQGAAPRVRRRRRAAGRAGPDDRVLRRHDPAVAAQRGDEPPRASRRRGSSAAGPGAAGRFSVNGEPVTTQARVTLAPDDVVRLELPGGGGYGSAERQQADGPA